MVMVHPTRRSGAGEDRLFRVLRPSANRIVRGRRSVMAHTISLDGSSIQRYEHCRTDAGPENAVAAVVLAADALAGLHVHGVGNSDGSGCQAAGEGGKTGSKGPLAYGCSPHDKYCNTAKFASPVSDNIGFAIESNEVSARLNTLATGGPDQAVYRNLRYDYGYSLEVPRGWYLDAEAEGYSFFLPYHPDGWLDVDVFVPPEPHSDRNSQLDNFSDWYSNNYLPSIATEHWALFQPISRSEVSVNGQDFYRLEYRLQVSAEYCVENAVTVLSVSNSFPDRPFEFATTGSVCESTLPAHGAERQRILNSFRP